MTNIGDTQYMENIVTAQEAKDISYKFDVAANNLLLSRLAFNAVLTIGGLPQLSKITTAVVYPMETDFRITSDVYALAYSAMSSGTYIRAKIAQKYKYSRKKIGSDSYEGWYAIEKPTVVQLQYANGKWVTDPNYTG